MSNSELVALLDEIDKYIGRFVIMGDRERAVSALWVFHTWAFEAADTTPYLDVSSPVKQCGKTRLFEVLELLVRRPQFGANHTEATLFRVIDQKEPTLLLDEIDRTFGKDPKLYAGIMAVLNTGYRHGATIPRNVGEGSNMKVKDFKTFCPKAFAGIGSLPDTLADRSISIRSERRAPSQVVERFRERREYQRTEDLRDRLVKLAEASFDVLDQAEPGLPEELSDRQQDVWEPLLAIADLAGADWPGRARAAAIGLHSERSDENDSIHLLVATRKVFDGESKISSKDLIRGLVDREYGPWAIWWARIWPMPTPTPIRRMRSSSGSEPSSRRNSTRSRSSNPRRSGSGSRWFVGTTASSSKRSGNGISSRMERRPQREHCR
jgi:hypothetical protein